MGIKWKKCKTVCGILAFVTGMTMLVVHLIPASALFAAFGMDIFDGRAADYQESREFRDLISGRLSDLLSVATGGKSFSTYGFSEGYGYDSVADSYVVYSYPEYYDEYQKDVDTAQEAVVEESPAVSVEDFGGNLGEYNAYMAQQQAHDREVAAEYTYDGMDGYDGDSGYYGYKSLDEYMETMAQNRNILYAVFYQGKLLYSNIEGYEEEAKKAFEDVDFSAGIDEKAYNFTLWYNRAGDGKVEIVKDGRKEDVYGDGVYSDYSRWKVPGYANYKLGESMQDTVIFMAAAKNPQLYMVRDDDDGSVRQYGDRLYQMYTNAVNLRNTAMRKRTLLTSAVILLAVSLLLWKSTRTGMRTAGVFLGKWCLELKILTGVIAFTVLVDLSGGVVGQFFWQLRQGFGYYTWSGDYLYDVMMYTRAGRYLAAFFWLFYLAALDFWINRKRQKTPVFDLLKGKDFKYSVQKRLVRRLGLTLLAEITLLVLFAVSICILHLVAGEYMNYLTGGYAYDYYEVTTEAIAGDAGLPFGSFGIGDAYMLTAYVVFGALCVFTLTTVCGLKKNRALAADIGALNDQILSVREGNLTNTLVLSEDTDLREAAENLNEIQKGMETALKEQVKSERMKVDLVTNVSHDIKTPLTSIISYVELLRQEQELPEHVKEFVRILWEKSERLKNIVQDVFEISKATSGQLPIEMENLDMGKLLRQTLADMNDRISQSSLTVKTAIPDTPVPVFADGQRLYRVFQNLLLNALQYSLEGSRVYLSLAREQGEVIVSVKNTSGAELSDGKNFTERFVRGDESRTDGGSGLGLSIAKSFTEACGGSLSVETDADLFTVTVIFPEAASET